MVATNGRALAREAKLPQIPPVLDQAVRAWLKTVARRGADHAEKPGAILATKSFPLTDENLKGWSFLPQFQTGWSDLPEYPEGRPQLPDLKVRVVAQDEKLSHGGWHYESYVVVLGAPKGKSARELNYMLQSMWGHEVTHVVQTLIQDAKLLDAPGGLPTRQYQPLTKLPDRDRTYDEELVTDTELYPYVRTEAATFRAQNKAAFETDDALREAFKKWVASRNRFKTWKTSPTKWRKAVDALWAELTKDRSIDELAAKGKEIAGRTAQAEAIRDIVVCIPEARRAAVEAEEADVARRLAAGEQGITAQTTDLVARTWTVPGAPDDAFGRAGWVAPDGVHSTHVTSDPDGFRTTLAAGIWHGQDGDLGPGVYGSDIPHVWANRAFKKWDFLDGIADDATARGKLADALLAALPSNITPDEVTRAKRDIELYRTGAGYIIYLAEQPYNMPFWKPEFLAPLGIAAGTPPAQVELVGTGTFAELARHPTPEEGRELAQKYDGAFTRGGWSTTAQIVYYRPAAVKIVEDRVTAGRKMALETAQDDAIDQTIDQLAGTDIAMRKQLEDAARELENSGLDGDAIVRSLTRMRQKQRLERTLKDVPGAEYVGETEHHWVYLITTWEGAKALGAKKWCIVSKESHWLNYQRSGITFHFYVSKHQGPPATYAVATSREGRQEIYDQNDTLLDIFDEDIAPTLQGLNDTQRSQALKTRELQRAMASGEMPLKDALAYVTDDANGSYFYGAMLGHPQARELIEALDRDQLMQASQYWGVGWQHYGKRLTQLGYVLHEMEDGKSAVLAAKFVPNLATVKKIDVVREVEVTTTMGDGHVVHKTSVFTPWSSMDSKDIMELTGITRRLTPAEVDYYSALIETQVTQRLWPKDYWDIVDLLRVYDVRSPYDLAEQWLAQGYDASSAKPLIESGAEAPTRRAASRQAGIWDALRSKLPGGVQRTNAEPAAGQLMPSQGPTTPDGSAAPASPELDRWGPGETVRVLGTSGRSGAFAVADARHRVLPEHGDKAIWLASGTEGVVRAVGPDTVMVMFPPPIGLVHVRPEALWSATPQPARRRWAAIR